MTHSQLLVPPHFSSRGTLQFLLYTIHFGFARVFCHKIKIFIGLQYLTINIEQNDITMQDFER